MSAPGRWVFAALLVAVVGGCATPPPPPGMLDNLRADLAALEEREEVTELAPAELADARVAVRRAGMAELDEDEREQRVWLARKHLEIARAEAFAERARRELAVLDKRRTDLLLRASRLEAEEARRAAEDALIVDSSSRSVSAARSAMSSSRSKVGNSIASRSVYRINSLRLLNPRPCHVLSISSRNDSVVLKFTVSISSSSSPFVVALDICT